MSFVNISLCVFAVYTCLFVWVLLPVFILLQKIFLNIFFFYTFQIIISIFNQINYNRLIILSFEKFCFRREAESNRVTDVTMRMLPLLRLLLAAVGVLLASKLSLVNAISNNYNELNAMERTEAIASVESSLLSLLGFSRRPRPLQHQHQGANAHVPEDLRRLYQRQNAIGTADIAKPGIHSRWANTVRSFVHVGQYI